MIPGPKAPTTTVGAFRRLRPVRDDVAMTMTRDARALMFSVLASSVFAVGSLIWGFFAGSQMIIFDGLYSFAGARRHRRPINDCHHDDEDAASEGGSHSRTVL